MPWEEFPIFAEQIRPCGYRPLRVRPYREGDVLKVAAVWTRDGADWKLKVDLGPGQLPPRDEAAEQEGLLPSDVAGYVPVASDEATNVKYVLLWSSPSTNAEERRVAAGLEFAAFEEMRSTFSEQGFATQSAIQVCTDSNGQSRYAGVWSNHGAISTVMPAYSGWERIDLPQWDVSLTVDSSSPDTQPSPHYAGLWQADTSIEAHLISGQTREEQLAECAGLLAEGFRPVAWAVASVKGTAKVETASVWHRPLVADAIKEQEALRQASAAVALVRLERAHKIWPLLAHRPDPRLRYYLLNRLASHGVDPQSLWEQFEIEKESSVRQALLLSLGDLAAAGLLGADQELLIASELLRLYRLDPDPGIHSASKWTLKQLGRDEELAEAHATLATGDSTDGNGWYVTKHGQHTMVILEPPASFWMGSPITEVERYDGPQGVFERRHRRNIGRTFAIGAHEVTVQQFREFREAHWFDDEVVPDDDAAPAGGVTWELAARYCNFLSEKEGFPESEWCFVVPQSESDESTLHPDYLQRKGYRLPSEAEWELACRAGAITSRFFGETPALLTKYAWYNENSRQVGLLPVGSLRPNAWGLFDTLGNTLEWCLDNPVYYATDTDCVRDSEQEEANNKKRVLRGGSFNYRAHFLRSARRIFRGGYDRATTWDSVWPAPAKVAPSRCSVRAEKWPGPRRRKQLVSPHH